MLVSTPCSHSYDHGLTVIFKNQKIFVNAKNGQEITFYRPFQKMGNGAITPATTTRLSEKSNEPRRSSFNNGERRKSDKNSRRGSTGSNASNEDPQEHVPRPPGKSRIRRLGVEEVSQLIGGLGVSYTPYIQLFLDQHVDGEFLCRLVGTEIDAVMEIMGISDGRCLILTPHPHLSHLFIS